MSGINLPEYRRRLRLAHERFQADTEKAQEVYRQSAEQAVHALHAAVVDAEQLFIEDQDEIIDQVPVRDGLHGQRGGR